MSHFRLSLVLTGLALVTIAFQIAARETSRPAATAIEPDRRWHGISTRPGDFQARPDQEFIADAETWANLWNAWRPAETLPRLDFRRFIVLLGTVRGPNRAQMQALLDDQGKVTTRVWGSRKGGQGFGYILWLVPRRDLRTINGKLLPELATDLGRASSNGRTAGKEQANCFRGSASFRLRRPAFRGRAPRSCLAPVASNRNVARIQGR